jgi:hypothetical protein
LRTLLQAAKISASFTVNMAAGRATERKDQTMANLVMTGLHHDTDRKRSIVYVRWEDDAEKNLGLIVPFGCSLEDAREEAAKAVQALAVELVSATVKL